MVIGLQYWFLPAVNKTMGMSWLKQNQHGCEGDGVDANQTVKLIMVKMARNMHVLPTFVNVYLLVGALSNASKFVAMQCQN